MAVALGLVIWPSGIDTISSSISSAEESASDGFISPSQNDVKSIRQFYGIDVKPVTDLSDCDQFYTMACETVEESGPKSAGLESSQDSEADSEFFGAQSDGQRLEAGGDTGVVTMDCARGFAIGSDGLIEAIEDNDPDYPDDLDEAAVVPGVYFSSSSLDSPNAALPTAGIAAPFEARLGVDFPCDALLIVRLEINDAGPDEFRVDFEIIPP